MAFIEFPKIYKNKRGPFYALWSSIKTELEALSNGLVTWPISPAAGENLELDAVTGKDIILKLTDKDGARKVLIKDSDGTTVASIDSNGAITGALTGNVTGAVTGNVTGNVTGDVTGNATGTLTGDVIDLAPVTIDYAGAHADATLSATQKKAKVIICTNADAGANLIGPAEQRVYFIINTSGQTITFKKAGGTGDTVANNKAAIFVYNGSDYVKMAGT